MAFIVYYKYTVLVIYILDLNARTMYLIPFTALAQEVYNEQLSGLKIIVVFYDSMARIKSS